MRRVALYLAGLALAASAVFFATYFFGRNTTLETELERLTAPKAAPPANRGQGIPSLQQVEAPPPAPERAADEPAGQPLGEGMTATRAPLEPPGMVIVVDGPALWQAAQGGDQPLLLPGLTAFINRPPAGLAIGLRSLSGPAQQCTQTDGIKRPGVWGPGELWAALDRATGFVQGPRNPAVAAVDAAQDLEELRGERAIVMLAGDEEACVGDLCGASAPQLGGGQRVHLVLLAHPPQPGAEPGMPEAGTALAPAPVFEPPWAPPYRCLAERTGGTVATASSPAELEASLRRVAGYLESALVVRAFHGTGEEVRGLSPDAGPAGWGVSVRPAGEGAPAVAAREAGLFPAAFALPAGVYVFKGRFGGQEKTAAVAVGPGERAEVRITFTTGELFVQALDDAGGEIVGDSAGFRCAWGAQVLQPAADETGTEKLVAETCSFPARFELTPGLYRLRARWRGRERVVEEVAVEAAGSAVRSVSFGEDNE